MWAIEPRAASALVSAVGSCDWLTHAAAVPRTPAAAAPSGAAGSGLAVVDLVGTLAKSSSSFGGTSTVAARRAVRAAAADPAVRGVVLRVDSPGGTVAGTAELAAEVRAAARVKPVWAFVEDLGASAAYWVASQADKVFVNAETALVGSIGTVMVVDDLSAAAEKQGVKTLVISTGPLKGAGTPGTAVTDDQRAYLQGLVDDAQRSFDAAVSAGRRLTPGQLAKVRSGAMFPAAEAVRLGLADGVRQFDAVAADLAAAARGGPVAVVSGFGTARGATMTETTTTPAAEADDLAGLRAAKAAELRRHDGILKACAGLPGLAAEAIEQGWPVDKAELHALRQRRDAAPAFNPHLTGSAGAAGTPADSVAAALLVKAGYHKLAEAEYGAGVMNRVGRLASASLPDLVAHALRLDGRDVPADRGQLLASGVSTGSWTTALGDSANKVALMTYAAAPSTWTGFAAVKSVPNFHTQTGVRPSFMGDLPQLPPAGEIKHGTFGEETYSWAIDTYAKLIRFDRKQVINDDLSLLSEVIPSSVKAARRTLDSLVWRKVMLNTGSFFAAGNGNYISGGTTVLGATGMGAALQKLRKQTDAEGNVLGLEPAVLAVPPELEQTARQLLNSTFMVRDASEDQQPSGNPYDGLVSLVVEPRLSNSSYTGYSTTAWYLFCGPMDAPVVVGFLDGNQTPRTEFFGFDSEPTTLAATWRVYHDFGAALGDYRAAVKSAGA